jgi:hypothetical protein
MVFIALQYSDPFRPAFRQWREYQAKILTKHAQSLNSYRPSPENNPYYFNLREQGARALPKLQRQLLAQLRREQQCPGQSVGLSYYIAYLMADIAGWSPEDYGQKRSLAEHIAEKYRKELSDGAWRKIKTANQHKTKESNIWAFPQDIADPTAPSSGSSNVANGVKL